MFEQFTEMLAHIPVWLLYVAVAVVIGLESMGLPLPGETTLVTATILAASNPDSINPWLVGAAGITGAIVGDSIGYSLGRFLGPRLIRFLRRFFPHHFSAEYIAYAKHLFARHGMPTVFFGRFIALLRILAGPLAGVLHMPYRRFLLANATGGILWAGGTTVLVYNIGLVAETWLSRGAWVAFAVLLVGGLITTMIVSRTLNDRVQTFVAANPDAVAAELVTLDQPTQLDDVPQQASGPERTTHSDPPK